MRAARYSQEGSEQPRARESLRSGSCRDFLAQTNHPVPGHEETIVSKQHAGNGQRGLYPGSIDPDILQGMTHFHPQR